MAENTEGPTKSPGTGKIVIGVVVLAALLFLLFRACSDPQEVDEVPQPGDTIAAIPASTIASRARV